MRHVLDKLLKYFNTWKLYPEKRQDRWKLGQSQVLLPGAHGRLGPSPPLRACHSFQAPCSVPRIKSAYRPPEGAPLQERGRAASSPTHVHGSTWPCACHPPLPVFTHSPPSSLRATLATSAGRRPSTPRPCVGTRAAEGCEDSSAGRACGIVTGRM